MCDFVADEAKAAANSAGNPKNFYCFLKNQVLPKPLKMTKKVSTVARSQPYTTSAAPNLAYTAPIYTAPCVPVHYNSLPAFAGAQPMHYAHTSAMLPATPPISKFSFFTIFN